MDISSTDPIFVSGTQELAKILQIVPNHDPTVLLTAVRIVIQEKLSESAISKGNKNDAVSKEYILNLIPWEAVLFVHVLGVWLLFTNAIPWFSDFFLPLLLFSGEVAVFLTSMERGIMNLFCCKRFWYKCRKRRLRWMLPTLLP